MSIDPHSVQLFTLVAGLLLVAGAAAFAVFFEWYMKWRDIRESERAIHREEQAAGRDYTTQVPEWWRRMGSEEAGRLAVAGVLDITSPAPPTVLHPAMTAQQLAEWCARYNAHIEIRHAYLPDGSVKLLIVPRHNP